MKTTLNIGVELRRMTSTYEFLDVIRNQEPKKVEMYTRRKDRDRHEKQKVFKTSKVKDD